MVYALLVSWAAQRFRIASRGSAGAPSFEPFVSLLKPLSGFERNLEAHLESFFRQDYPSYEILFAAADADDPALAVVARLCQRYPQIPARVLVTGPAPWPNAKVYSLEKMTAAAGAGVLVISDSDVFVGPDYLRCVVRPFADPRVGVTTCVYRGVPGAGFWSRLEALAMSGTFMPGVLVAWAMEGMKFALGPTMAVRRECLQAIGGFAAMADYLADDFLLGNWADRAGFRVVLSPYVVDHQVLGEGFAATFKHRLRWARSTRRSRPWGYLGEGFTHPLAAAVALLLAAPHSLAWAAVVATLALRWLIHWSVSWQVLRDPYARGAWWLVPVQDLMEFAVWCAGFTGRTVMWRGTAYYVGKDGRFERAAPRSGTVAQDELAAAGPD
jgi:ceramide glucosyltransferase